MDFTGICVISVLSLSTIMVTGYLTHWDVTLNDFWGIWYYGDNLNIREPASLYNGFFPIGYALLISTLLKLSNVMGAYAVNAISYTTLLLTIFSVTSRSIAQPLRLIIAMLIGLHPSILIAYTTLGPDVIAASLIAISSAITWSYMEKGKGCDYDATKMFFIAGVTLGASTLFRSHSALFIPLFTLLMYTKKLPLKYLSRFVFGSMSMAMIQILVNMVSGHGPIDNAQNYNVYKTVHGIDWWNPPTNIPTSTLNIILSSPSSFLQNYFSHFSWLMSFTVPGIIGSIYLKASHHRFICMSSVYFIVLYSLPVSIGGSPRAWITILIFICAPAGLLCSHLLMRLLRITRSIQLWDILCNTLIAFAVVTQLLSFMKMFAVDIRNRMVAREDSILVYETLRQLDVGDATEIFTDSFDLYFEDTKSILPRRNGGWMRYATWKYTSRYPQYTLKDIESLTKDFKDTGVKYVVLTRSCGQAASVLSEIHAWKTTESRIHFKLVTETKSYKVFKII